jgi:hypothetical protein
MLYAVRARLLGIPIHGSLWRFNTLMTLTEIQGECTPPKGCLFPLIPSGRMTDCSRLDPGFAPSGMNANANELRALGAV